MLKLDKDHDLAAASDSDGPTKTSVTVADDESVTLSARSYEPGDCVTWEVGGGTRDTDVVDCDEPHRTQVTAKLEPPGTDYPNDEAWALMATGDCAAAAQDFLGSPLDPHGRYVADLLYPEEEGWLRGERRGWCTLRVREDTDAKPAATVGDVRDADQQYHFAPGDCIGIGPARYPRAVPCDQPHQWEILGRLELTEQTAAPGGIGQLHVDCGEQAVARLGQEPRRPWQIRVLEPAGDTWASGGRIVHCIVFHEGPDGQLAPVSEPAPRG
jgi:hypothetical protein